MDPLDAIAAIGTLGGLLGAHKAQKTANAQLALQQQQAQRQADLFNLAYPYYGAILQALSGTAGLNVPQYTPGTPGTPDRRLASGRLIRGTPGTPGTLIPGTGGPVGGPAQLPYTNVGPGQLGIYANPTDALRLRAAEDEARQNTLGALNSFSFGSGQRGLYGSSIDAAGRAAILGDALRGQNAFARQLAIQAPETAIERLTSLAGVLGPGLGAGPAAANIFGRGAEASQGQANMYGQQAGGALANWTQYRALQGTMGRYQPGTFTPGIAGPVNYGAPPPSQMAPDYGSNF